MKDNQGVFSNPAVVGPYVEEAPLKVPGLFDLHRMAMLLLSERAGREARILVVGAGGGMELRALAEARQEWRFAGVDPSAAMLDLARRQVGSLAGRMALIEGTVEAAPAGPFEGALCLLTLHFLDRPERLRTLRAIHDRLRPGARLVIAHHCAPGGAAERWLARSAAFADRSGSDRDRAVASARRMAERLPLLSDAEEEDLLREAGFADVELFYAAFSFRGWVASAG